tara:strand:- start:215 stop:901 length:687 start_codon:yes stop_codon:yes gene_type:complete
MKKPIFKIKNLSFDKNELKILNIKKFEIHRSACYLFNGNMASGKTLLLDILTKNNSNYKGMIDFEGRSLKKVQKSKYKSEIMYVRQHFNAPYFKTVKSYIYSHVNKNGYKKNTDKIISDIVKVMDFKYIIDSKMRHLTPSQLRWVNLAAKIAAFPKVLFIDEIELHLNMAKIKSLCKILYRKVNYDGITIIATTQNKEFFDSLSSVSININHGRITSVRSKPKYNKKK